MPSNARWNSPTCMPQTPSYFLRVAAGNGGGDARCLNKDARPVFSGSMPEPCYPTRVEEQTTAWVSERLIEGVARGGDPATAVFDAAGNPQRMSRYHFQSLQRKLKIFRWLDGLDFASFIDIGSGFDCYPYLAGQRYGVPAYYSDLNHQMNMPFDGSRTGKIDHAVTLNLIRLPFPDGAFDVVLASEVLEHLVRPVEAIAELLRITRKVLIMTSLEALVGNRRQRFLSHFRVDVRVPHVERNFFLLDEFRALFGDDLQHENLLFSHTLPANPFEPDDRQEAAYASLNERGALERALCHAVTVNEHRPGAMGILLVKAMPEVELVAPDPHSDRVLARWLIDQAVSLERSGFSAREKFWNGTAEFPATHSPIAPALLAVVRCPDCGGPLSPHGAGALCPACQTEFPGSYGVPILYPTRASESPAAAAACVSRLCGTDARRARVVQRLMRRLRRNEGPPGRLRQLLWKLDPGWKRAAG